MSGTNVLTVCWCARSHKIAHLFTAGESVVMVRKSIMAGIAVIFWSNKRLQVALGMLILFIFALLQLHYQPFRKVCFVTLFGVDGAERDVFLVNSSMLSTFLCGDTLDVIYNTAADVHLCRHMCCVANRKSLRARVSALHTFHFLDWTVRRVPCVPIACLFGCFTSFVCCPTLDAWTDATSFPE